MLRIVFDCDGVSQFGKYFFFREEMLLKMFQIRIQQDISAGRLCESRAFSSSLPITEGQYVVTRTTTITFPFPFPSLLAGLACRVPTYS